MMGLAERLKNARTSLHLSQEYVAQFLKINRAAIVQIEAGKRKVSANELQLYSALFGYTTDELLNGMQKEIPEIMFARKFSELDEVDQHEIMSLMEFKKMIMDQRKHRVGH